MRSVPGKVGSAVPAHADHGCFCCCCCCCCANCPGAWWCLQLGAGPWVSQCLCLLMLTMAAAAAAAAVPCRPAQVRGGARSLVLDLGLDLRPASSGACSC
jgi:hypothetical protein